MRFWPIFLLLLIPIAAWLYRPAGAAAPAAAPSPTVQPGRLAIPAGTFARVDGVAWQKDQPLSPGRHQITLHAPGCATTTLPVTIRPGQTTRISGELADISPPEISLSEQNGQLVIEAADRGGGLAGLWVSVNDRPYFTRRSATGGVSQQRTVLPLPPGTNRAQAVAVDRAGQPATGGLGVTVPISVPVPTGPPPALRVSTDLPGQSCLPPAGTNSFPRPKLRPSEHTAVTILLLGSDSRQKTMAGGRTDTILLVRVKGDQARLLSVPRDLWVTIPGYGQNRINTVYRLAELNDQDGPALLRRTLARNLGLTVDYYALVDFAGFEAIVDHLGGVELCVPETIDAARFYGYQPTVYYPDRFYSYLPAEDRPGKGWAFLYIEAGRHHLDGQTALRYARSRASNRSDFDRTQRQQAILLAMRRRLLQLEMAAQLPDLWETLVDTVQTDLSLTQALRLSRALYSVEQVEAFAIGPAETDGWTTPQGAQVLLPRPAEMQSLIERWRE